MGKYEALFSPITIGKVPMRGVTVNNRTVMTPMGTNYGEQNGEMSFLHMNYYEERAKGGAGLIIVENACVKFPEGSNGTTQLRIDTDNYIPRLYKLCETCHNYGTKMAIQLNHAGASALESRIGMQPVSASDLPNKEGGAKPRPLTVEEIYSIADDYASAAKRAQAIGFDAVEIHGGHSYLISQFLSPLTNNRTDEFGGCAENRARFAKLVVEKVRKAVGPFFPIIMRLSADEFLKGGNTLEDTMELLTYFVDEVDVIHVSAGLVDSIHLQIDANYLPDGWKAPLLAKPIKEKFGKPVIIAGNIRDPKIAEEIIQNGEADFIGMGRQFIADPQWPNKVKYGHEDDIRKCISCNVGCAGHRIGLNRPIRCTVNPNVTGGEEYKNLKVKKNTNVVVIGGGTAGLEAACTAAEVGCTTFLIENTNELGGLSGIISKIPEKYRVAYFKDYLIHRAEKLPNLFIFKGFNMRMDIIDNFKPDIVVNATGSVPLMPPIPGLKENVDVEGGNVKSILGMIDNIPNYPEDCSDKKIVVVGGGAVGLDVVEFFANRKAEPTIIEMAPAIGTLLDPVTKVQVRTIFRDHNVNAMVNTALKEVHADHFVVERNGERMEIPFDYGFNCLGMRANNPFLKELEEHFKDTNVDVYNIGDSVRARQIIYGVAEGRNIINLLKQKNLL
ncbi:MAG: FAD-dependent oxidoreductase [Firmicutes bacterium]|nr:FAD-dependent oxidoreductase [Bacillota bacterium]